MHLYRPVFPLFFFLSLAASTEARDAGNSVGALGGAFGGKPNEGFLKKKDAGNAPEGINNNEEEPEDEGQLNENEHPMFGGSKKHKHRKRQQQPQSGAPHRRITPVSGPLAELFEGDAGGKELAEAAKTLQKMFGAVLQELQQHPSYKNAGEKNDLLAEKRAKTGHRQKQGGKPKHDASKNRRKARDMQQVDEEIKNIYDDVLKELQGSAGFVKAAMKAIEETQGVSNGEENSGNENGDGSA